MSELQKIWLHYQANRDLVADIPFGRFCNEYLNLNCIDLELEFNDRKAYTMLLTMEKQQCLN